MSAIRCTIQSQSHINSGVTPKGMMGTPRRCVRASYTVALSVPCAELGPVVGNGHGVVHQPTFRLDVQRDCRHGFGDGEHREEGVAIDLLPGRCIREATPDVHHAFTTQIGRNLQADLATCAYGKVNSILNDCVWVGCHSSPSRPFFPCPDAPCCMWTSVATPPQAVNSPLPRPYVPS